MKKNYSRSDAAAQRALGHLQALRLCAAAGVICLTALFISGCGGTSAAEDKSKIKVGIVFDIGGKDDRSFNAAAWEGVQRAAKDLPIVLRDIEPGTPNAIEPAMRAFAERNFDLIIGVGFAQCLAMVPGVSRSGATIMGALAMGVGRKTAAEFSFFLAVPTMVGASTLELLDNHEQLTTAGGVGWGEIAIGFVVSFVVALAVIRGFVAYVSRHGFAPFAWYRIVIGAAAVAWLAMR